MVINAVNAGSVAGHRREDEEQYENMGAYLWGKLRDDLREGNLNFPNDAELVAQLSTRKYMLTSKGKIALERKDDMKKRGLPSPDKGDAVALTCYAKKGVTFAM